MYMSYEKRHLSDISGLQKIFRIPIYKKIQKKKLSVYDVSRIANQAQQNRQAKKLYTIGSDESHRSIHNTT